MDFRMEKISYVMLALMLGTMAYFILQGAGSALSAGGYLQVLLFAILTVIALIALSSIPVLIYCFFVKKIPDIDYSINLAFVLTIVGIISEFTF
jgi:ABC-type transport system involved in cytochrome c biogenesis permease component